MTAVKFLFGILFLLTKDKKSNASDDDKANVVDFYGEDEMLERLEMAAGKKEGDRDEGKNSQFGR